MKKLPVVCPWLRGAKRLTGHHKASGRAHRKRLRREPICIAARVTHYALRSEVHTSGEHQLGAFGTVRRLLGVLFAAAPQSPIQRPAASASRRPGSRHLE